MKHERETRMLPYRETRMKELGRVFEQIIQDAIAIMANTQTRKEAERLIQVFENEVEQMPEKLSDMILDGTSDAKWSD